MASSVPQQFRAAQFTKKGGNLEIRQVQMKQPGENEIIIKVRAASLNSTDQILRNDLLPGLNFPLTPSSSIVGKIVKMGRQGGMASGKLREGMDVAAVTFKGGLGEYAKVHECNVVEIKRGEFQGQEEEAAVFAFDAGRVWGTYRRCEREYKHMDEHERRLMKEVNERLGFGNSHGCIVVYGEGGYARLALDILRKGQQHSGGFLGSGGQQQLRVILVATTDRWSARDYDIEDKHMLLANKGDLRHELKQLGGACMVVCVDQPRHGFENLLDSTRYGATLAILNPTRDARLEVPLANIIAKSIRVQGPPILSSHCLEETLQLCQKQRIRAAVKKYRFDQNEVNQAWRDLEQGEKFEAPLVVFQQ